MSGGGSQIEGKNPVLEALKAGRPINRILISNDIERHTVIAEILHLARLKRVPVDHMSGELLKMKSLTGSSQGVIAYVSPKGYADVDGLIEEAVSKGTPALFILLDGLEDPHNLGAILRTADAAGVNGVIIPERRSVGLTETVSKVSAGAIEYVPVARVNNLNNAIKLFKDAGIKVVGIEGSGTKDFREADLSVPVAIVIGGEGKGISRLVKENCDEVVNIPMKGKISSLNASVAAGVIMYEVLRQRTKK